MIGSKVVDPAEPDCAMLYLSLESDKNKRIGRIVTRAESTMMTIQPTT